MYAEIVVQHTNVAPEALREVLRSQQLGASIDPADGLARSKIYAGSQRVFDGAFALGQEVLVLATAYDRTHTTFHVELDTSRAAHAVRNLSETIERVVVNIRGCLRDAKMKPQFQAVLLFDDGSSETGVVGRIESWVDVIRDEVRSLKIVGPINVLAVGLFSYFTDVVPSDATQKALVSGLLGLGVTLTFSVIRLSWQLLRRQNGIRYTFDS